MSSIRILCFNIHGGRNLDGKRHLNRIYDLMERLHIDIGVFQEMETRPSRGACLEDVRAVAGENRPYRFAGISIEEKDGWYGNLIVSRYPLVKSSVHNLETHADLEPRNAVDVTAETPYGPVRLIGTHLSLSYIERYSEAQNLYRLMKQADKEAEATHIPLLLMGDINEWQPWSKLLDFLNREMHPVACRATFPSFFPIFRLDRIWHESPDYIHVTAHRLPAKGIRTLSDHLPLLAEVHWKN